MSSHPSEYLYTRREMNSIGYDYSFAIFAAQAHANQHYTSVLVVDPFQDQWIWVYPAYLPPFPPMGLPVPEQFTAPQQVTAPQQMTVPQQESVPEQMTVPQEESVPEQVTAPQQMTVPQEEAVPEQVTVPQEEAVPEQMTVPQEEAVPRENAVAVARVYRCSCGRRISARQHDSGGYCHECWAGVILEREHDKALCRKKCRFRSCNNNLTNLANKRGWTACFECHRQQKEAERMYVR